MRPARNGFREPDEPPGIDPDRPCLLREIAEPLRSERVAVPVLVANGHRKPEAPELGEYAVDLEVPGWMIGPEEPRGPGYAETACSVLQKGQAGLTASNRIGDDGRKRPVPGTRWWVFEDVDATDSDLPPHGPPGGRNEVEHTLVHVHHADSIHTEHSERDRHAVVVAHREHGTRRDPQPLAHDRGPTRDRSDVDVELRVLGGERWPSLEQPTEPRDERGIDRRCALELPAIGRRGHREQPPDKLPRIGIGVFDDRARRGKPEPFSAAEGTPSELFGRRQGSGPRPRRGEEPSQRPRDRGHPAAEGSPASAMAISSWLTAMSLSFPEK